MGGKTKTIKLNRSVSDADADKSIKDSEFNQKFVYNLGESNSSRNAIKDVMHEVFRSPETQEIIKNIVNNCDRDSVKVFWNKFGFIIWTAGAFVVGSIFTAIVGAIAAKYIK